MLTGAYETLRAAGRPLELPLGDAPSLELRGRRSSARVATRRSELVELLDRRPAVESLLDLSGFAVKGDDDYEQARDGGRAGGAERRSPRATARCSRSCSRRSSARTRRRRTASRRSTSRISSSAPATCSATNDAIREREQLRFRQVCVDEFQDTNRLQCEVIDLIARDELFFVGDEFQSIYRFRHADVEVFKERREAGRRRAAAHRELALAAGGARGRQPALRRDLRRRVPAAGRRRALPRPGLGPRGRAARHRQVELQGHGRRRGGAARRGRSRGA